MTEQESALLLQMITFRDIYLDKAAYHEKQRAIFRQAAELQQAQIDDFHKSLNQPF